MNIEGREINSKHPPYIVADISASHNGDIERGRKLIRLAATAGADAVKFQAYLPHLVSCNAKRDEFIIKDGPWKGRTLYELYVQAHTPRAHLTEYFAYAKEIGITAFATACAKEDVDFLVGLGCPAIKIASMDIINIPLIEYVAKTGLPTIISTGMASWPEIRAAEEVCRSANSRPAWLCCTSNYNPCPIEEANLWQLRSFRNQFLLPVGFSDHTIGAMAPTIATGLGACIIEKHITILQTDGGPDDHFAATPVQFLEMTDAVKLAYASMQKTVSAGEEAHRPLRPSLRAVAPINYDEEFTEANVRAIRPGGGLPPSQLPFVLGQRANRAIEPGEPILDSMLIPF